MFNCANHPNKPAISLHIQGKFQQYFCPDCIREGKLEGEIAKVKDIEDIIKIYQDLDVKTFSAGGIYKENLKKETNFIAKLMA